MNNFAVQTGWVTSFDERERNEIALARQYAEQFHHGTAGHLSYMTMAKMAKLLDEQQGQIDLATEALSDSRALVDAMFVAGRTWPPSVAAAWQKAQVSVVGLVWIPAAREG